ncbi:hypothetical protein OH76DRAFT_1410239, partial [Lentinus brumalis]
PPRPLLSSPIVFASAASSALRLAPSLSVITVVREPAAVLSAPSCTDHTSVS